MIPARGPALASVEWRVGGVKGDRGEQERAVVQWAKMCDAKWQHFKGRSTQHAYIHCIHRWHTSGAQTTATCSRFWTAALQQTVLLVSKPYDGFFFYEVHQWNTVAAADPSVTLSPITIQKDLQHTIIHTQHISPSQTPSLSLSTFSHSKVQRRSSLTSWWCHGLFILQCISGAFRLLCFTLSSV